MLPEHLFAFTGSLPVLGLVGSNRDKAQICMLPQIIAEARCALDMGVLVSAAGQDTDGCRCGQTACHLFGGHLANAVIIRTNVGDAGNLLVNRQERDAICLSLRHPLIGMMDVDRRDNKGIDAALQQVLNHLVLLTVSRFVFWRHDNQADIMFLCRLLHAGAHSQPMFAVHRLEDDPDRIGRTMLLLLRALDGQEHNGNANEQDQEYDGNLAHDRFLPSSRPTLLVPVFLACRVRWAGRWLPW